jgi:hypothetical protein
MAAAGDDDPMGPIAVGPAAEQIAVIDKSDDDKHTNDVQDETNDKIEEENVKDLMDDTSGTGGQQSQAKQQQQPARTNPKPYTIALWPWMVLAYSLGIIWFGLHPLVSIMTGELKCRGHFIDEKALLNNYFTTRPYNNIATLQSNRDSIDNHINIQSSATSSTTSSSSSYCDIVNEEAAKLPFRNMHCYTIGAPVNLNVVQVLPDPATSPIARPDESVVFIVPSCESNTLTFDAALMAMMQRLATDSPWLAKSVLIVSSSNTSTGTARGNTSSTLADVATRFEYAISSSTSLPVSVTSPIIRQVLVVDLQWHDYDPRREAAAARTAAAGVADSPVVPMPVIAVVPQGRGGIMPNLDLVFMVVDTLSSSNKKVRQKIQMYPSSKTKTASTSSSTFLTNVCGKAQSMIQRHASASTSNSHKKFAKSASTYVTEMCHMLQYMKVLAFGLDDCCDGDDGYTSSPYDHAPPHSIFLERGLDSLTLELPLQMEKGVDADRDRRALLLAGDLMAKLEHMVRALSNLDEILHHSVTLYWMPSSSKFVSNAEYMFPLILMLLPLVVRVLQIAFRPTFQRPRHDRIYYLAPLHIILTCIVAAAFVSLAQFWLYDSNQGTAYSTSTLGHSSLSANNADERKERIDATTRQLKLYIAYVLLYRITLVRTEHILVSNHFVDVNGKGEVPGPTRSSILASVQFFVCYGLMLLHLPYIVSNAALALPSLLLWSLLWALPNAATSTMAQCTVTSNNESESTDSEESSSTTSTSTLMKVVCYALVWLTAPPVWVFCLGETANLRPTFTFVYVSIHLCWTRFILAMFRSSGEHPGALITDADGAPIMPVQSKKKIE